MAEAAGAPTVLPGWDAHVHVFDSTAPVLAGHYRPQTHALEQAEAAGERHGIGRLVLVQPSVYGTDNSLLVHALCRHRGRHRGVAVLDGSESDAELDALHDVGVRGVRFNQVSPVGNGSAALARLAPRLRERGWHVQWYVHAAQLAGLVPLQRATGLAFVLDHLAGITAGTGEGDPCWSALAELAAQGSWIKLSGWYRLGATEPYAVLVPQVRRVASMFGPRMVWGSDWPHTSLVPEPAGRHASLLAPVVAALGEAALAPLLTTQPGRLYAAEEPVQPGDVRAP